MVQGSQTQWVPILQYSGHRSKLTNRWSILILTQLNNLSSHVRNTKTHLPPLIPGLIHPTPSSSCLTKKSQILEIEPQMLELWERERASESESERTSEKAEKLAQLCKGRKCMHVTGFRARPGVRPPRYVGWPTVPALLRTLGLNCMVPKPKGIFIYFFFFVIKFFLGCCPELA
jgi:hypothetical protein